MATGVREPDTSVATATKPVEQAPQALDADPCEGRFDDRCPSLSALRQSTGHRPASRVTNNARSNARMRVFGTAEPTQQSYIRRKELSFPNAAGGCVNHASNPCTGHRAQCVNTCGPLRLKASEMRQLKVFLRTLSGPVPVNGLLQSGRLSEPNRRPRHYWRRQRRTRCGVRRSAARPVRPRRVACWRRASGARPSSTPPHGSERSRQLPDGEDECRSRLRGQSR